MPRGEKGKENLRVPRSSEEAKELGRKGGIASGEARRKKKTAREIAEAFLSVALSPAQSKLSQTMDQLGLGEKTQLGALVAAHMVKAQSGDVQSAMLLLGLTGQAPASKSEISGSLSVSNVIAEVAARRRDG